MKSILIVDDDETLLRSWQRTLHRQARVHAVKTASEARGVAAAEHLDVVVIDYSLGGSPTGVELLRELKLAAPQARFLLLTGYATTDVTIAAVRAGADDVRAKPVMAKAVLNWVELGTWEVDSTSVELSATLERVQLEHVRRVVADCGGNISEAARRLGVQRLTIRRYLEKRLPRR